MGKKPGKLDYWRDYFRSANSDIFQIIENAILVAASDCPVEFLTRRGDIAEKLFSCRSSRCLGCDRVELQVPYLDEDDGEFRKRGDVGTSDGGGEKGSNVHSSSDDHAGVAPIVSSFTYDEAEALTEEIEEETQIVGEVLRIKEVLSDKEYKSDSAMFESLRRLQLMELSVETLRATEIGKIVNGLRKHNSKQIRHLARILVDEWKVTVDEWFSSTTVLAEATPESADPSGFDEEEGLPLPPLDEGAFLTTQTSTIELSQFFDGMDDDGNLQSNIENEKKPPFKKWSNEIKNRPTYPSSFPEDRHSAGVQEIQNKQQELQRDQNKQTNHQSNGPAIAQDILNRQPKGHGQGPRPGLVRPPRVSNELNAVRDARPQNQPVSAEIQKKPQASFQNKMKNTDDNSVQAKLEIAKRRLHEGYQQAESAKKQRTIQVMELHDLPKQDLNHKQPFPKPMNHNRHWANGRY